MKDWFYDRIVRRNERIQKEYERYVRGHLEEHKKKDGNIGLCFWDCPGNTGTVRKTGSIRLSL